MPTASAQSPDRPRPFSPVRSLLVIASILAITPASAAAAPRARHCGTFDFGMTGGYTHVVITNGSCALARRVLRSNPPGWKFSEAAPPRAGLPFGVIKVTHGSVVITAEPTD